MITLISDQPRQRLIVCRVGKFQAYNAGAKVNQTLGCLRKNPTSESLSLVGVLRRQPSVWLNETTSSMNSLDFTQLKNCSSPKKKYIDIPIPHSNIYDRWAIQECFTRIFLQKIVLFHIDDETYVERRLLLHWLGHENFVRRRSNDVNFSSLYWGKKSIIDKGYRLTSSAKQWCHTNVNEYELFNF